MVIKSRSIIGDTMFTQSRIGAYSTQAAQGVGANKRKALIWDRR